MDLDDFSIPEGNYSRPSNDRAPALRDDRDVPAGLTRGKSGEDGLTPGQRAYILARALKAGAMPNWSHEQRFETIETMMDMVRHGTPREATLATKALVALEHNVLYGERSNVQAGATVLQEQTARLRAVLQSDPSARAAMASLATAGRKQVQIDPQDVQVCNPAQSVPEPSEIPGATELGPETAFPAE